MSTLSIWESVRAASGLPVLRLDDRVTKQSVSFTGTAGQSDAFDEDTSIITVRADADCAIAVGADPEADTDDYPLAAGVLLDLEVQPGLKISVVAV